MSGAVTALPLAFAALIGGSILAYVLMDGWDLGVGILSPLVARRTDVEILFDSIAPFWDANETWLVFGGMMLLTGFPLAYATLMPHIYVPLFMMLASLVLRGVSYEFQHQGGALQRLWQLAFAAGSIAAALCQGWILGLVVEGIEPPSDGETLQLVGRQLFPVVCAIGVLGGYALLGSCWLILKTRDALQVFGREVGFSALILTGTLLIAISVWTPLVSPHVARRWLTPGHLVLLWVLPVAAVLLSWKLKRSLWGRPDGHPLLWAILLFMTGFAGILISVYPFIVPYRYTLFEAANDTTALRFAGVGVAIVLPITILYLILAYRVFRGKVLEQTQSGITLAPHMGARRTSGQQADLHLS